MLSALLSALQLLSFTPTQSPRTPAPATAFLGLGPEVQAPYGFLRFCQRRPDQCGLQDRGAASAVVALAEPMLSKEGSGLDPRAFAPAPWQRSGRSPDLGEAPSFVAADGVGVVVEDASGRARLRLSEGGRRLLEAVNRKYNELIRPMSDEEAFGVSNYWTLPIEDEHAAVGNCKHYAMEKRKALADAGVPASVLSLALVRTPQGELHAVLVVATEGGDVVLDNLTPGVSPWRRLGYRWLVRQTPGTPLRWVSVPAV